MRFAIGDVFYRDFLIKALIVFVRFMIHFEFNHRGDEKKEKQKNLSPLSTCRMGELKIHIQLNNERTFAIDD